MIVEVIAVGTELLIGQIVNSNVAYIGRRLAEEGFEAHHQVTVGDDLERLAGAIATASERADAVILTGGIGPTQDDLTREALCRVTGTAMRRNEEYADAIAGRIEAIRGTVPENTLRMADHPEGAEQLPNRKGVALGLAMRHGDSLLFALPGVPVEMTTMLDEEVLPRLRLAAGTPAVMRIRVINTWGQGESGVAEILDPLFSSENPSVAFLIHGPEVSVRLTARADSPARADEMIAATEEQVVAALGNLVFGRDEESVEMILRSALEERGWTIGVAEVATAGLVGSRLGRGLGSAFRGSTVLPVGATKAGAAFAGLADPVDAMSEPAGAERARSVAGLLEAEVGLWIGPAVESEDGTWASVVVGVATPVEQRSRRLRLLGDASRVAEFASVSALHLARLAVSGGWWGNEARQ